MLCPFHLGEVGFRKSTRMAGKGNSPMSVVAYRCPDDDCGEDVPALYVRDFPRYPPVVVSAVGFTRHGKTVYLASLFHAMRTAAQTWEDFFYLALNEQSLETVKDNLKMLEEGKLPPSTPKNFPKPTLLRIEGVPCARNCTWVCYDTGGECFDRASQLVQYAGFVARAKCVLFLLSLPDLPPGRTGQEAHYLLNTYIIGMSQLQASTRRQHLAVVLTKGDAVDLSDIPEVDEYLRTGTTDDIWRSRRVYLRRMSRASKQLEEWLIRRHHAAQFVNAARQSFASVCYTIISALGTAPIDGRLATAVQPRRVFDPILWLMHKSLRRGWCW